MQVESTEVNIKVSVDTDINEANPIMSYEFHPGKFNYESAV